MLNPWWCVMMCFTGATSAPCLIFIFPAVFYIRIVPKEEEPSFSVPKILVSVFIICEWIDKAQQRGRWKWWRDSYDGCYGSEGCVWMDSCSLRLSLPLPGRLLRRHWLPVYDNEPQLHHHWLDYRYQQRQQWALNTTFHFTGFTLSVVTSPVFILNDCQCQCYPAWAERTFSPTHNAPVSCPSWRTGQ